MFSPSPYAWNAQYLFGFFFCYGVYLPFWAVWLAHLGVSSDHIGLLIGLGLAVRCVANLILTPRWRRLEQLRPALQGGAWLGVLFCVLHAPITDNNLSMLTLITVLFNLVIGPIMPLSDSYVNAYAKQGALDYGRTRLWGSFAFIVGSTLVGWIVKWQDPQVIPWVATLGMALTALLSLRSPNQALTIPPSTNVPRLSLWQLLKRPAVLKLLVLVALLQGSHAAYYSFSALYWQSKGMSEAVIGLLWSFSVLVEIAVFAFSRRWFAHWSIPRLFMLAGIGVVVRWSMVALFTDIAVLTLAQGLHGITFAVAHLATVRYIQNQPSEHTLVLHSLYNALPLGAVMALMTGISGILYGVMGEHVFWIMALMGVPALFWRWDPTHLHEASVYSS